MPCIAQRDGGRGGRAPVEKSEAAPVHCGKTLLVGVEGFDVRTGRYRECQERCHSWGLSSFVCLRGRLLISLGHNMTID